MNPVEKLLSVAKAEVGYLEKQSNHMLDDKEANAGNRNYTKYARDLYPELQGQPWCDMFADWCFVKAFGKVDAKRLIGGGFSAYTPISAQYYKDKGRYFKDPQPGDQIFFHNGARIYHTGIVKEVTLSKVRTYEGNTSSGSEVVANGGAVCEKEYSLGNPRIDGYGRPDWSVVETVYELGWHQDSTGWWYADTAQTYYAGEWANINGHRYYFNADGYAVTGWQQIAGEWYYFEPTKGHPLECALYVSDKMGVQSIGDF